MLDPCLLCDSISGNYSGSQRQAAGAIVIGGITSSVTYMFSLMTQICRNAVRTLENSHFTVHCTFCHCSFLLCKFILEIDLFVQSIFHNKFLWVLWTCKGNIGHISTSVHQCSSVQHKHGVLHHSIVQDVGRSVPAGTTCYTNFTDCFCWHSCHNKDRTFVGADQPAETECCWWGLCFYHCPC